MHMTIYFAKKKIFFQEYIVLVDSCINVHVLLLYSRTCLTRALFIPTLYCLKYTVHNYYVLLNYSLLPVSFNIYVVFPSFPFNPIASSVVFYVIIVFLYVL